MNMFKTWKYVLVVFLLAIISMSELKAANPSDYKAIGFGLRLGINSSNQGINFNEIFPDVKKGYTEWKTGFDIGAVVDLNITKFLTLQPGFFFQNRSYDYTIIAVDYNNGSLSDKFGHTRSYHFQIPILLSLRLNLSNDFRWNLEFGPYIAFGLGGDNKIESYSTQVTNNGHSIINVGYERDYFSESDGNIVGMQKFDWGFKMGTAFTFRKHYSLGIHYSAGCKNIANQHADFLKEANAKNKIWSITLGYDF